MVLLEIFDPPMCCHNGVCGSSSDPTLLIFASDLEWLKEKGVEVVRYGLSFEQSEFIANSDVKKLMGKEGNNCLPIFVVNGKLSSNGKYLLRDELAKICKIEYDDDEAPPVHREANCCCGVDCDCSSITIPESTLPDREGSCANAAAEENCLSKEECACAKSFFAENILAALFLILLLAIVCFIVFKFIF